MARTNTATRTAVYTHEGARAQQVSPELELRRTLMTCLLWEDSFYEKGSDIAARIAELVKQVKPEKVAELAIEAREKMYLRHAPLFVVRELARQKGKGGIVADTLERIIQRADELAEFVSLYWKEKRQPLSAGVKRGLARAFRKFSPYALAKYNRDNPVKLRDVLFLCHAKPKDQAQADVWKKLVDRTLESPDTWEVALSSGADKKLTWERLLAEDKLGGLALLRNLRNMQQVKVEDAAIRAALDKSKFEKVLPFRFVAAAKYAPSLEDSLESAMYRAVESLESLGGSTGILCDGSGSMTMTNISEKSEINRMDAAMALALLIREKSDRVRLAVYSSICKEIPPRRGFGLYDKLAGAVPSEWTKLRAALTQLRATGWDELDRIIVVTDEQSHDGIEPFYGRIGGFVINVAPYKHGISYGNGWTHIDGWSERVLDFIRLTEAQA